MGPYLMAMRRIREEERGGIEEGRRQASFVPSFLIK